MQKIKNIIIGFGKGGKTLAKFLAQQGEQVLMIEKSQQMYGGTCINIACLPSKRLITEANNGTPFEEAVTNKNIMTSQLRNKNYHMLADEENITVIDGQASFIDNYSIAVTTTSGVKTYTGERIFINTGAQPVLPDIPGLKGSSNVLNSTLAMSKTVLPKELVIIGAGYIGLEFANMFAEFGSHVIIISRDEHFLSREDDDVAAMIYRNFTKQGIDIQLGVHVKQVRDINNEAVQVDLDNDHDSIIADKVLVATGRRPVTAHLGLENTDIQLDQRGAIVVDERLHTNVPNVWAIGDVKGGPQFTFISLDDFRIIKDELFGDGHRNVNDRLGFATSTFINPPLSQVGLTEKQAQKLGKDYLLFKLPVTAIPKAKVLKDSRGLLKVLVNPQNHLIIGATLYVQESHEIINMVALAMRAQIPYEALRDQIYTHPTISESFNDLLKKPIPKS